MSFEIIGERKLTDTEIETIEHFRSLRREPVQLNRRSLIQGTVGAGSLIIIPPAALVSSGELAEAAGIAGLIKALIEGAIRFAKAVFKVLETIKAAFTLVNTTVRKEFGPVRATLQNAEGTLIGNRLQNVTVPAGTSIDIKHEEFKAQGAGSNKYNVYTGLNKQSGGFKISSARKI